jgi:hypothetical protein
MPREVNRAIKFTETLLICYALFVSSYLVFLIPIEASLPCRCFRRHRAPPSPPTPAIPSWPSPCRRRKIWPPPGAAALRRKSRPTFPLLCACVLLQRLPGVQRGKPWRAECVSTTSFRGPNFASRGSCASASGVAVGSGIWALPVCCVRSTTFFLICCQRYLEWLSVQIDSDFNWFPGIHACQNYNRLLPD